MKTNPKIQIHPLRAYRKRKGLSQQDVADRINADVDETGEGRYITQPGVSAWENWENDIDFFRGKQIRRVFPDGPTLALLNPAIWGPQDK